MLTLREKIGKFLRENPPPKDWEESLRTRLPATGDVTEHIPLVIVTDCQRDKIMLVLILAADEVCTEKQCVKYDIIPPDGGVFGEWDNLVPKLVEIMLIERFEEILMKETLSKKSLKKNKPPLLNIPGTWSIIFNVPTKKEITVGASSQLHCSAVVHC